VISGALDAAGPGVAAYYGKAKREEFLEWHSQVSSWEIDRYLMAF
jgi:glutamine synthetase